MPALLKAMSTPAVGLEGRRVHPLVVLRAGDVGSDEQAAQIGGNRGAGVGVHVDDDDGGALGGESLRGRQSDAARAPGDECDATFQTVHELPAPARGDEDVLGLGERIEGVRPELAAEAGLLEAAERRRVAHRRVGVDRQVAGLDGRGRPAAPGRRRGSRSSRTARSRCRWRSGSRRPRRRTAAPRRPGRRSPRARRGRSRSKQGPGPLVGTRTRALRGRAGEGDRRSLGHVGRDRVPLAGADQRPHLGACPGRGSSTRTPLTAGSEQLHEPVVGRPLHQDPRAGAAVLAGVVEDGVRRGGGGLLEVGVGEDDVGALAAELEGDPLDLVGAAGA